MLTAAEMYETCRAYADAGMTIRGAAKNLYLSEFAVSRRLAAIEKYTGYSPRYFDDLVTLVELPLPDLKLLIYERTGKQIR